MPELFDKEGNPVKAFTREELDAQMKAQQEEWEKKQAEKDQNFAKVRQEAEEAKKTAAEKAAEAERIAKEKEEALAAKDKEYSEKDQQKERDKAIDALAQGNSDLKEKLQFHMNRLKDDVKTPEDFQRVLQDSYILATGHQVPDKLTQVISSAGSKGGSGGGEKLPISEEALAVAKKMGLSVEDIKKYNK